MKTLLLLMPALLLFAGCATPTRFEARVTDQYGYQDEKLSADTYHVDYVINENTDADRVKKAYIPLRGGELCRKAGYAFWEVQDFKDKETKPRSYAATIKCFKKSADNSKRLGPEEYRALRQECVAIPFAEDIFEKSPEPESDKR